MKIMQPIFCWGGVKIKVSKLFDVFSNILRYPELVSESNAYRFRNKFGMTKVCKINNNRHPELVSESKNIKTLKLVQGDIKRMAFTLSEVLITLVVIGIVAAITVPTLFANYQEKALRSALTKNYSVFKQVFDKYYLRNGERFIPEDMTTNYALKALLKKELNVLIDCGLRGGNYYPCLGNTLNTTYKHYKGNTYFSWALLDDGQFVLNDGTHVFIENPANTNSNSDIPSLYISVDVNGAGKKPNRLGRDLFMFQVTKDGDLKPMGAEGTKYPKDTYCNNTSTSNMNGAGCTVKVLSENKST